MARASKEMAGAGSAENPPPPARRRVQRGSFWVAAVVATLALHGGAFLLFEVASGHRDLTPREPEGVHWIGERADEAIDLLSPKPLFLPTRWNASARELGSGKGLDPGYIFPVEPPRLSVDTTESPAGLVGPSLRVRSALGALEQFDRPYFSALGRRDRELRPLPARVAMLDVQLATSGESVMKIEVPTSAVPDAARWPFWGPFEALLAVEPSGAIGAPLIPAPGSGVDIIDDFFRRSLRGLLRPELMLPGGYYRVLIGP